MPKYVMIYRAVTNWGTEDHYEIYEDREQVLAAIPMYDEMGPPEVYELGPRLEYKLRRTEVPQPDKVEEYRELGPVKTRVVPQKPKVVVTAVPAEDISGAHPVAAARDGLGGVPPVPTPLDPEPDRAGPG